MTDFINMTKTELAAIIGGMTASQIKKASHASLIERAKAAPPTADQMQLDESNHFGIDPDDAPAVLPTAPENPAKAPKAANAPSPKVKPTKAAQAAPTATRKPGGDCILFIPAEAQKEPKAGSKRAAIIGLLRAPTGTTVEDIAAATEWSRAVAGSALYVDVKGSGWGVERIGGRLHLLPQGVK